MGGFFVFLFFLKDLLAIFFSMPINFLLPNFFNYKI
jgi:hypothetical protein